MRSDFLKKREHATGILVLDDSGRLVGIFTTKDLVLRVVARGLDPANTSVIRVMVFSSLLNL
jgi:CBS domain-containing protein